MSYDVDWVAVRDFLARHPVGPTHIIAGSPEWQALDDDDPAKLAALITAGSRWVLEQNLEELDQQRAAKKHAAIEIATALDWTRVAKRIRDRDQFYRDHPDLRRKKVS